MMQECCFICTTPYQIVAASVIANSFEDDVASDLYILPRFRDFDSYKERVKKTGIFRDVFIPDLSKVEAYKSRRSRVLYNLGIVANYLNCTRITKDITNDRTYSKLFISSQASIGRLLSLAYTYRLEGTCETVFFDDGEGSYDNDRISNTYGADKLIRTLIFGKKSICLSKNFYLYSPELYKSINGGDNTVNPIADWGNDKELLQIVNEIVGYDETDVINERFILIDTIPEETFSQNGAKNYQIIRQFLIDDIGSELIIKTHPRDKKPLKEGIHYYSSSSIPFEVICANSRINDKVLITASSTAVLMPKLLFGSEPTVLLLYKMTEMKSGNNQKREQFISYIKNQYQDQRKVIIPTSISELKDAIEMLRIKV